MGENLITALEITVIGMGLVFGAIFLLWGVMALLVRLAQDPAAPDAGEAEPVSTSALAGMTPDAIEREKRAVAIAVSVALMRHQQAQPHEFPVPPTPIVSAWQAVMRGRLLQQKGPRQDPRRTRPTR
ncbi:MAG: OadG family protein [Chloroflexota bacterium]|mgnify:CR=1 FL=1|jgi:Na+-transporting methylmalonyl-CoA/oxaloacetate decarboxylase gamma subunit|nr:OadG family protein [Anaerolineae bacterium]HMM29174.1 OadG family protein [Aggregatilineaceae bacterium]